MDHEILMDISEDEKRVAILEKGRLSELFIVRENDKSIIGNIYLGVVENILPGIQSAFINIGLKKNAFISLDDRKEASQLKKNQEILVQVTKEAWGGKGVRVTTDITLPGRHLVYTPFSKKIGVSRNIPNREERERLRNIVEDLSKNDSGFIIRTEAEGGRKKDLIREGRYLIELWNEIKKRVERNRGPLIYESMGIVLFVVRELFTDEVSVLFINSRREFKDILRYVKKLLPHLTGRVKLYKKREPIFSRYNLEGQIEALKNENISLPCGGYIIIQQTEALTSIDINTGGFSYKGNKEETAFRTNMEACKEIVHQLRLRNIGGIIIVDFVDMKDRKNREKVLEFLRSAVKKDKAKIDILPITRMGLLEMTRERKRDSILNKICQPCPYCEGSGRVFSEATMYIKIKKAILRQVPALPAKYINVFVNPRVAPFFSDYILKDIENITRKSIRIRPDYKLHQHEFEITA